MMKHEFENLICDEKGDVITNQDYEIIETVYMNYPNIKDKEDIANLYKKFGMTLIKDMHKRALSIRGKEEEIRNLNLKLNCMKEELKI